MTPVEIVLIGDAALFVNGFYIGRTTAPGYVRGKQLTRYRAWRDKCLNLKDNRPLK